MPADRPAPIPDLRALTDARVALGRFGAGVPTRVAQAFALDHARAREAVWSAFDADALEAALGDLETLRVASRAPDRASYIRRPDLGRMLCEDALHRLARTRHGADVVIVAADGLSARALELNAAPLILGLAERLLGLGLSLGPIVIARQARVALGDGVGAALGARLAIVLIGERPGLTAADSLGAYLTHRPRVGTPDAMRNCVSNIRARGLPVSAATETIARLALDILRARLSGTGLKSALAALDAGGR